MPDYERFDKHYSLSDLMERGNPYYNGFDDLPYEAQQALSNYSDDYTFEHMRINPRFLPFNFPFFL